MEKVSSAVEMVLPLGVFMTTMPRWVAASTSTLSTPTPARPTTRKPGAPAIKAVVTFVSERTTRAVASATIGKSSDSACLRSSTVTENSGRCCKRAMPLGETGSQTTIFISSPKSRGGAGGRSTKQRRAGLFGAHRGRRVFVAERAKHPLEQAQGRLSFGRCFELVEIIAGSAQALRGQGKFGVQREEGFAFAGQAACNTARFG